jgi:hypothetical protein
MAELVDAPDSKSGIRKDVQVRFLFWALENQTITKVRNQYGPIVFQKLQGVWAWHIQMFTVTLCLIHFPIPIII